MFNSCICIEPDECVTLLSRTQPTARKQHICYECGTTIRSGEKYQKDATVFEEEFHDYKICMTCLKIRDNLFECGWYYGGIWEEIHQTYCLEYQDEDDYFCLCPN